MASALRTVRRSALPAGFAITVLALSIHAAHADTVTDLGSVGVQAQSGSAAPTSTAAAAAPSSATLQATEPQSIISRTFMDDAKPADADYTAIAAISPSVAGGVTANGPGLGETKNTIRGFQDGQYNITWDGIPFGDTNGPTHHSTAYFPDQVIGSVDVERGPGNADDLGQATYGGSLNLFSRDISNTEVVTPFYSAGSWDTQLKGARYETGVLDNAGGAKASVAYQDLTSDGYLTYSGVQNQNLAFKVEKPIGDKTLLTVDLNHDANQSYTPDASNGITLAQAAALGKNQSLGIDPTQGNYFGYNRADKSTDMDYARLQSDLGSGWAVDNKLYYYNYVNDTFAAANASPGAAPEITSSKCLDINGNKIPNCIPAYEKINKYWVSGDIFKTTKQFDSGQLLAGLWVEHAETFRARTTYDAVNGEEMYTVQATTSPTPVPNDIKYDQNSAWNNYQPFVEYKWTPTDNLTVTPGFKYENTLVNLDAEINQTSREAQNIDKLFTAKLPYLTANYRISNDWSTYAQYATGVVVPDISYYQSSGANGTDIEPQTSTNYQAGVVRKSDNLVFDADVYYIKLENMLSQVPGTNAQPEYYNGGSADYKGVEAEATYALPAGFSVFANGSVNHAISTATDLEVANAPLSTEALGGLYNHNGWNASWVFKEVGEQYVLPNATYKMDGYSTTDVTVGYTFNPGAKVKTVKLQFGIYNLQNHQSPLTITPANTTAGTAGYGQVNAGDTYTFQAARSYMASVILSI